MKYILRALLILLLISFLAYNQAISEAVTGVVGSLRAAFALPILTARNFFRVNDFTKSLSGLELENQSLRAEIMMAKIAAPPPAGKFIRAKVHASYPFNNKSALTIAVGGSDGVREGMAVLVAPGIYLGFIGHTEKNWSEVKTIFDGALQTPVRIGDAGIAALLRGGGRLTASMIDKAKFLEVGAPVYLAQKGLPYGLKIGEVRLLREGDGGVFKEADVFPPYVLNDLEEVLIYAP